MKTYKALSPDGVSLSVVEWGNPAGREILFIHGVTQSHLCWSAQYRDQALAARFRMVAFDLRGHGMSGQPHGAEHYTEDARWAADVAAVIAAAGLKRPIVVCWSYGGRVLTDYLRAHGHSALAAIHFVAANAKTDPALFGPERVHLASMASDDLATAIAGTRAFVRACFARQPAQEDFETVLAYNMMVPPHVRRALNSRVPNPGDVIPTLRLPVLVTHGAHDSIILPAMGEWIASSIPGAQLSIYPQASHSPFAEDSARFNRELVDFAGSLP